MNKVTTINLSGRAYQVEEAGYDALKKYLEKAGHALKDNPDKDEIVNDLEAAIASKCDSYLTASKNVITVPDMETILGEMGPVAGEDAEESGQKADHEPAGSSTVKRLYRIREGAVLGGVCNGLAAYFDVDVTLVRLLFVLLVCLSVGWLIPAYIVMVLLVPTAKTPEERAAAHGAGTVTAKQVVDRARDGFEQFTNWKEGKHSTKETRKQGKQWRRQMKNEWKYSRRGWGSPQVVYRPSWIHELVSTIIGFFWLLVIFYALVWGYHHVSGVHQLLDTIGAAWDNFITSLVTRR